MIFLFLETLLARPFMQALNLQALGAIFGSSFLLEKVPISLKDGSPLGPHFEMC